jgi:hypothetical protein
MTVIAAVPVFVSLVAVIVTGPTATAVKKPEIESIRAMLVFALDHLTTRPVSTLPLASRVVAESCNVPPTWTLDDAGETDTDATATGVVVVTERGAAPITPSLEAVILVAPAARAVTMPEVALTEATLVFALDHVTTRPVSTLLLESRVVSIA